MTTPPFTSVVGTNSSWGTEYFLVSGSTSASYQTTKCKLRVVIDLANLVAGDEVRLRVYDKVNGGSATPLFEAYRGGTQGKLWTPPVDFWLEEGWEVSLKRTAGSDRAIPWSIKKDTGDVNAAQWNALTTVELPLVPTVAGRKLDVSAGGEAGLDWANVGSPTTVVGLSGTTIKDASDSATRDALFATATALATAQTAITAIKLKTDSLTFTVANMVDSNTIDWKGAAAPAMTGDAFARLGAPAGASVSADVAGIKGDTAAIGGKTTNLPSDPADASDIAAAFAAVTGAFAAVNATLATLASYVDTEVAAIKLKTDNLPSDPADASDIAASFTAVLAAISGVSGGSGATADEVVDALIASAPYMAAVGDAVADEVYDPGAPAHAQTLRQIANIVIAVNVGESDDLEEDDGVVTIMGTDGTTPRIVGSVADGARTLTSLDGR